jgi:predicted nuclease of restriction endonuclease-like (RecB) superfamily
MSDTAPGGYGELLKGIKERIRAAQVLAALAVNRELVLLYWQIGHEILARQQSEGWGSRVIDRLARDLKAAFPDMQGLSARNLKYMRAFAEAWPAGEVVQQVVAQLPWGHNVRLLDRLTDRASRVYGMRKRSSSMAGAGPCWSTRSSPGCASVRARSRGALEVVDMG